MKASETSLRNLLEGTKQFQIPLFQRPYSWEKEKWITLWEDLMSLYTEEVKGDYFLGPIVTQAIPGTAEGISPFIVIDGQQRLVTLSIILATMRHQLLKQKKNDPAEEMYELYLINKFKKGEEKSKVLPTQEDREVYMSIIDSQNSKNVKNSSKIYDAYKFFEGKLKKPDSEGNIILDLVKLKGVILERLILVNITSDDSDNPYLIFESLNNKGQDLTQADLVRNYIFMKLPRNQQEEVYKREWLPLQEQFRMAMESQEYSDELTNAFWFYLRKDGKAVNQKEVYKSIKQRFEQIVDTESQLKELVQFATYYHRLSFPEREPEIRLRNRFERLIRLDFKTCHIFLLNVYSEYEQGQIDINSFEKILIYLESYFVRRFFAGISTRSLGSLFNTLFNQVKQEKSSDIVDGLRTVLSNYEDSKSWPTDDRFREGIITKPVYSSSSIDRVKLILESIEKFQSKEKVDAASLTVEHIMPKKLSPEWKHMLGGSTASKALHKQWLHTLGNLTLTGYNSELSNKTFPDKRQIYKDSNLSLNKYLDSLGQWNAEEIKKRGEKLAEIALKIWPR